MCAHPHAVNNINKGIPVFMNILVMFVHVYMCKCVPVLNAYHVQNVQFNCQSYIVLTIFLISVCSVYLLYQIINYH